MRVELHYSKHIQKSKFLQNLTTTHQPNSKLYKINMKQGNVFVHVWDPSLQSINQAGYSVLPGKNGFSQEIGIPC